MDYSDPSTAKREDVESAIMQWRGVREQRLMAEKEAAKIKDVETELKSFVLECFKQQKLEGMLIGGRTTGLSTKMIPTVCDKEQLLAYIRQTGELELLQFRLSEGAVKERWENEVEVPGVEEIEIYDLFDRKV